MKVAVRDLKIIWYFFKNYKIHSFIVLVFMLLSGFFEMLNLAALYPIINYGLSLKNSNFVLENFNKFIQRFSPGNPFLAACFLLIAISFLTVMLKLLYHYLSSKLLMRIMGDTQKRMFDKFVAADYGFYVNHQQGELIYAGTIAPEKTTVLILQMITLAYHLINAFFLFFLLVVLSWKATFIVFGVGFFYATVIKNVANRLIRKSSQICVNEKQRKNVILNEFITGIKSIKIFLTAHEWKGRYTEAINKELVNKLRMMIGKLFPENFVKFLFYILIASTGIFLSQKPSDEMIALLPLLGTFGLVVNRFLPSLHAIGSATMSVTEALPDTKIVYGFCQEEIVKRVEETKELQGFNDKIAIENLWFKYEDMEGYLLKNVSFSIDRRKMTALVGYSGSGKTTIINLLLKLYRPEKGSIKIDGEDIFEITNRSYLSRIGYVSQETFIFNTSIKENIRFGMENCTDQMIEESAKLANAHEFIMETENGYDTIVGDAGVKLSGGQRQRVAIARAMLRKPEIIVFDEATSSLDNISEKKIQTAINNISKHTTVLVIAHRLSTVQNADKIIILEKGEIKEQGTHQELLDNKDVYYRLHRSKDDVETEKTHRRDDFVIRQSEEQDANHFKKSQ